MNQFPEQAPLKTITKNGIYHLRVSKPKVEKVRVWDDGTMSCYIFFKDAEGNCLNASYGTLYAGSLAMMVGRMSGKWMSPFAGKTPEDFVAYVSQAAGKTTETLVEVSIDPKRSTPEKTQYKYKLTWAKKGQTLTPPDTF